MRGSRNLNRIFRVTATLLFEKGEELASIQALLEGFVEKRVVRAWREKWLATNGEYSERIINGERLPLPPIDWSAVKIETLKEVNELGNASVARLQSEARAAKSQL
jgi:hypothetical protein